MESAAAHLAISVSMGAWQVCTFFRNLKNLDRTVNAFICELESLTVACEAIGKIVKERLALREEQLEQLWECLETQLRGCNTTISQLELAVDNAKLGTKKDKSPFGQMVRQVRINGKSKEIELVKSEIHAHTSSIEMIIHAARIKMLYLASGRVDGNLSTELAQLNDKKQELHKVRAQRDPKRLNHLNRNETEVIRICEAVAFGGETLYASSVSNPSVRGDHMSDKAGYTQRWIGNVRCDPPTPETETPSVFSHSRGVRSSTPFTPETDTLSAFSYPRDTQGSSPEQKNCDEVSTIQYSASRYDEPDPESDDEVDIETVQRMIKSGRTFFERRDFNQASLQLGEALKMVRELPNKREGMYDTCELRYMVGVCAFHLQEPSNAMTALLNVLEGNSKSGMQTDASRLQVLEASHLLSMTYFQLGMLDKARSSCQEALKGRRKLLGKENEVYHESLELMAKIWNAEGNPIRAQVYRDMVSDERRSPPVESFAGLPPLPARPDSLSRKASEARASYLSSEDHQPSDMVRPLFARAESLSPKKAEVRELQHPFESNGTLSTPNRLSPMTSETQVLGQPFDSIGDTFKEVPPPIPQKILDVKRKSVTNNTTQTFESDTDTFKEIPPPSATILDVNYGPLVENNAKHNQEGYPYPFTFTTNARNTLLDPVQNVPAQHEQHASRIERPDGNKYQNEGLGQLAQSMKFRRPSPADYKLRQVWRVFFNITPKKELSFALLENRKEDALNLIPDEPQKKAKLWSRKLRKPGNDSIDRKDLLLAALFGDTEIVDKLIRSGVDLQYHRNDLEGLTALHCAALGGYCDIASKFIATSGPTEVVLQKYGTPLALAVLGERIDVIDLLLAHTTTLNEKCGNLGSVMHAACATGNAALVGAVGARIRKQAWEMSAVVFPSVVRELRSILVSSALPDPPDEVKLVQDCTAGLELLDGRPIAIASYMGCNDVVEYLISQMNLDINALCGAWSAPNMETPQGSNEHTALTVASGSGQDEIVRMLLQKGAKFEPQEFKREDALLFAILNDRTTCALLLLEHGAPVSPLCFREATKRSMLPLVGKMRAKRGGTMPSTLSTYSHDKSGAVMSVESISGAV